MAFNIALSGLNAASADLNVTSHNIANTGTAGFKGSRAEFGDIFATSQLGVSSNAIGQGVKLSNVRQQHTQGQFEFTGNSLDLGVSGTGFFRLSDAGAISYTRAGAFELNREGFVVSASGSRLTGYTADMEGNLTGAVGDLQVNTGNIAPQPTSELDVSANLNSNQEQPTAPFDVGEPDSYNFSTSTTVFDSLGRSQLATLYFVKGAGPNEWEAYTDVDGDTQGPADLAFNTNGSFSSLNGAAASDVTYTIFGTNGAADRDITVDFGDITQFGTPFSVSALTQDGFSAGQFSSLDVGNDGTLFGRFTNGQSQVLGQVALAKFASPEKLTQLGDTKWAESFESGPALLGTPETSGLGNIEAGALEQSNVNITEQLVKMITAQRNFQANAKMISTQDQVTQEIINIR